MIEHTITFGIEQEKVIDAVIEEVRENHIERVEKTYSEDLVHYHILFKSLFSIYAMGYAQGALTFNKIVNVL